MIVVVTGVAVAAVVLVTVWFCTVVVVLVQVAAEQLAESPVVEAVVELVVTVWVGVAPVVPLYSWADAAWANARVAVAAVIERSVLMVLMANPLGLPIASVVPGGPRPAGDGGPEAGIKG